MRVSFFLVVRIFLNCIASSIDFWFRNIREDSRVSLRTTVYYCSMMLRSVGHWSTLNIGSCRLIVDGFIWLRYLGLISLVHLRSALNISCHRLRLLNFFILNDFVAIFLNILRLSSRFVFSNLHLSSLIINFVMNSVRKVRIIIMSWRMRVNICWLGMITITHVGFSWNSIDISGLLVILSNGSTFNISFLRFRIRLINCAIISGRCFFHVRIVVIIIGLVQ